MEIYVLLDKLDDAADQCSNLADRLSQIDSTFTSLSRSLDWEIKSKANIISYINNLSKQINKAESTLHKHSSFLQNARTIYMNADNSEKKEGEHLKNDLYQDKGSFGVTDGQVSSNNYDNVESEIDKFIDKLSEKGILKILSEYGKYDVGLSFGSALLSIFTKIKNYYNKYITGISSTGAFVIDTISTGLDMFGTWAKSVFVYDNLLKASKGVEALKDTGLQNFCKNLPIINIPIKFAQSFSESYAEYSADGNFTRMDFAETLVDSAVSGLFATGSAALTVYSGPVSWIKGALMGGSIVFDSANSGFELDKKASDSIKDWAKGMATQDYNSKNTFEKAVYKGFYGIGWAANKALDFGEAAVKGVKVGV